MDIYKGKAVNDFAQISQASCHPVGIPVQASIMERLSNLEQRVSADNSSVGKMIEELYQRISHLEQLVRGQ